MPSAEARTQASKPESLADVDDELKVALLTRQELGKDMEDEVIESFLSRVQDAIDARVEARVRESLHGVPSRRRFAAPSTGRIAVVLSFITLFLIFLIPLADIAGSMVAAISIVACIALAGFTLILPEKDSRTELGPGELPCWTHGDGFPYAMPRCDYRS